MQNKFSYKIGTRLGKNTLARTGVISTPHGNINTPAFIVVGTKAAVKTLTPEQVSDFGTQAVLANAYHLYLQPGHKLIEEAGGLHKFMNWHKPTFTDSGGFQVLSLGSGFKKVLTLSTDVSKELAITQKGNRHAWVHEDGVVFKSHLNGERHQFTPEISMQIQHSIGADICFAFDELTSLMDSYEYQVESLERTHRWAVRSLQEMRRLHALNPDKNYQALFGVLQGAHYEDLRKQAAIFMASQDFDGYGIGGALEKKNMAKIIRWVNEILPENKPRHLLGISEPEDIFGAIEQGIDTFDCVSPTRIARNGTVYTATGKINVRNAQYKNRFEPIDNNCPCYTCQNYTLAYLCHLLRAKETLAGTLLSIHNEYFIIHLVDSIRESIEDGSFFEFRSKFLSKYSK